MKLIAALLVVGLTGCTTAPLKVFMGDYKKVGDTKEQLSDARNFCSDESLKFRMRTPATGTLSVFLMQKFMLNCMKEKGYEPLDIHPEAFNNPLFMGQP
jgi:hypothetical protein